MFRVNKKDNRMTLLASFCSLFCWLWTYFIPCSSVSIVNFEHVTAGWSITSTVFLYRIIVVLNVDPKLQHRKKKRVTIKYKKGKIQASCSESRTSGHIKFNDAVWIATRLFKRIRCAEYYKCSAHYKGKILRFFPVLTDTVTSKLSEKTCLKKIFTITLRLTGTALFV